LAPVNRKRLRESRQSMDFDTDATADVFVKTPPMCICPLEEAVAHAI
jgi:hypothetical protein